MDYSPVLVEEERIAKMIVESAYRVKLFVSLKAVDEMKPVFEAQLLSYEF